MRRSELQKASVWCWVGERTKDLTRAEQYLFKLFAAEGDASFREERELYKGSDLSNLNEMFKFVYAPALENMFPPIESFLARRS